MNFFYTQKNTYYSLYNENINKKKVGGGEEIIRKRATKHFEKSLWSVQVNDNSKTQNK